MKRKIIKINTDLCDCCGQCVTACAEGALQIVDGKAKLVKEIFCDGFGDCVGECPTGALVIEEREADEFDMNAVRAHVENTRGAAGLKILDQANRQHESAHVQAVKATLKPHPGGGCPGSRMRVLEAGARPVESNGSGPAQAIRSELSQWPVQLHLVPPDAPFFKDRELVVLSTCAPVASADVHWRFVRGRAVVVACPKLDETRGYVEKLAGILAESSIPKVIVLRMEVPCCGGLSRFVAEAIKRSGRTDLVGEEITVALKGDIYPPLIL
jgi:ferredoxin